MGHTSSPDAAPAADTFVAVGYGGRRMVSPDGRTWKITAEWAEKGGDDSNNLMSLVHAQGKFVATGGGGFSRDKQAGHILLSTDGSHRRFRRHLRSGRSQIGVVLR